MLTQLPFFFHHVCHWINKNRQQTGEIICLAMQQQKTSLRCDSHADLLRDRETATSLETFFGKKYLNVTKQFRAVARGQSMKKYDMTLNQRQPVFRKRSGAQATSPLLLQQLKDHMKMSKGRSPSSPQWVRFGVKNDFIEFQSFGRSEEQIKIFKRLGQDEALH